MRILALSWRGPAHPARGGAEIYLQRVLRALAARGHRVTWFCEAEGTGGTADGVHLVAGGHGLGQRLRAPAFVARHRDRFDIVVDQVTVAGFLAPLWSPLPVLALVHQRAAEVWGWEGPPGLRRLGPAAEALLLRPYRRVPFVTVSRTTLEDLRAAGLRGPAWIAWNGVEPPPEGQLEPKETAPTLVFLGRFQAAAKRLPHALATWERVRAARPGTALWVIGRGRAPAAPAGAAFFPDLSDAERDARLSRAWLLLATSVREGWGRMVLEAAACGTPSAVYPAPGLEEAAAAACGAVSADQSPAALAATVDELLRDPAGLHARGAAARAAVAAFRWTDATDVWEAALTAAAGRPGG
jgi:glycosyltransferase involved in cell wall biosynthesis